MGIDLGTTNCAVAYADTKGRERPAADLKLFEVPQLVSAGETVARPMLPSFLYLLGRHELPAGAARTPWREASERIVGEFARVQGARVPSRLVASAKSWLCHAGVDRAAEILPWGVPKEVPRVSPVEATAELLRHIRDAWNWQFARDDPRGALEDQELVVTVPASFDEAARELTVEAAHDAGLKRLTLLEEPQAAFYCWIVNHQDGWQKEVRSGELILVCDVGGGTTDFSLITVVETPTGPGFRRVAVGDHLMLGGDNIDLALAHRVEAKLGGARLDSEQWSALRYACRTAKEKLLADEDPAPRWPVAIAGRGARLIGGGFQSELTREEALEVALEGFLPMSRRDEEPDRSSKLGLQEFGLPYVADPAIPRHLAAFLRRHRAEAIGEGGHDESGMARPDTILFNGGAMTPRIVRERVEQVVTSWFAAESNGGYRPRILSNESLDLAVAFGAAYYGVVRRGGGIRIGGGTARSIYVGITAESNASTPWLCVVPRDAQEGDEIALHGHDLELTLGQPVTFPLASSSVRPKDQAGDLAAPDADSIRVLPPLVGMMRVGRKAKAERVPVRVTSRVTEVGTVELWCQSVRDDRRWRLQIQLRGPSGTPTTPMRIAGDAVDRVVIEQSEIDAGRSAVRAAFEAASPSADAGVARLVKHLESALDAPRAQWPPSALRALWDPLRDLAETRLKTPQHEARWLNLAGYCLRPGLGFPLDDVRIKALWPVFHAGVKSNKETQCWVEWWVLWRRVAAGLNRSHHEEIFRRLQPFLLAPKGGSGTKKPTRPKPAPHELAEMWRCAAALERLDVEPKEALGAALIERLKRPEPNNPALWCLGRIGARVPLYGPANTVIAPGIAERWAETLLARDYTPGREATDAVFALSALGRVSNDRARDIDVNLRARILKKLEQLGADEETLRPVREYHELASSQEAQALGDALPTGLRLIAPGAAP